MKWFQHNSDAKDDIKLKRLRKRFGLSGVGAWWCIVEIVAKEGVGGYLEFKKYPKCDLAAELDLATDIFDNMLNFMSEVGLVTTECLQSAIWIPKLEEKADDWTKREEREEKVKATRKRKPTSKSLQDGVGDTHHIIYYYIDKHKEVIDIPANINWGRDCKLFKDLLKTYKPEDLKSFIDEFFAGGLEEECWWADKLDVPVFKTVIGQLIGRIRKKGKGK